MDKPRVLVIGLDGGTFDVLRPFAEQGLIPNLAKLMKDGARGILRSSTPPISAPAWATFQTGKQPGKHGVFNFFDLSEMGGRSHHDFRKSRVVNHASIQSATVYDYLREGGRKVISVNIPLTYPTPEVDGCLVSCWLCPPGSREFTYPRSLAEEIPDYRIDQDFGEGMYALTPQGEQLDSEFLLNDLSDILKRRGKTARYLVENKEWDVCMVCFTETDRLQHYLWRAINPDYQGDRGQHLEREREGFRAFYRDLDAEIGRLMDAVGDDVNVIVMSDHGFDAPPSRRYHVSHWMMEQGWLVTRSAGAREEGDKAAVGGGRRGGGGTMAAAGRRMWQRLVPPSLRDQVYSLLRYTPTPQEVDWSRSRAWSFGVNNNLGAIWINEVRPDGGGCVASGHESRELVNAIHGGLKSLTDPRTGKPVVRQVMRREELYDGPYVDRFPHLLYWLDPDFEADYESGFVISSQRVQGGIYPEGRGNHRPEGICIASGPDIEPGGKGEYGLDCIMPTVLHLVGLPVPGDLDGQVMTGYLTERALERQAGEAETGRVDHRFSAPTEDDVQALQEKLRKLGYM